MFSKRRNQLLSGALRACLSISMLLSLALSAFPQAQVSAADSLGFSAAPQAEAETPEETTPTPQRTYPSIPADKRLEALDDEALPMPSIPQSSFRGMDAQPSLEERLGSPVSAVEDMKPEDIQLSSLPSGSANLASPSGSLPAGLDLRSLPPGMITIDLAYDVVMGWVNPGQAVSVTASSISGYGAAVADAIGFFWTPIWHNTDGHQIGIDCGWPISITPEGDTTTTLSPKCLTGASMDLSSNLISGGIDGVGADVSVTASLGGINVDSSGTPPSPGAPIGSDLTDSSGAFSINLTGVDLGAESLVALDFLQDGLNMRHYITPENVFMVHQMNSIAGYADIDQGINATVYVGSTTEERWSGSTTASGPYGFYSIYGDAPIEPGDTVEVLLDGEITPLTTTVMSLGNFSFDAELDTLLGDAPNGAEIRMSFWQWQGEDRVYSEEHTTASSSGIAHDFTADLKARDDVLVVVTDASGNQTQILSGAPFISALQDPLSDTDCVSGRLDSPYAPIFVSLDKGEGETYTRETTWTSDAGNDYNVCFIMRDRDWAWGPINFDPGDIATLSDGAGFSESVEVLLFDWTANPDTEQVSGTSMPEGDVEILLIQWMYDRYPLYGTATQQADVSSGSFTTTFTDFDLRDGNALELRHYDLHGNGNTLYAWGQPALPYFELQLQHNAVSGMVSIGNDYVEASLYDYDGTSLLATTHDDGDDDPWRFWFWDFGGHNLEPGYKVVVSTSSWSAEMIVPDLAISGDYDTDTITGKGPQGLLMVEASRDDDYRPVFVPSTGASDAVLDLSAYGYDLRQGDFIALTYQAPDGNRARLEARIGDLYKVGHWFNYGERDWMWGEAVPGSSVTIIVNGGEPIFATFENQDPGCPSCWGIEAPIELNPGYNISVTSSLGSSIYYTIPNPLTATADSDTDIVSGQIGGRSEDWVNIYTWWDGGEYQVMTGLDGSFTLLSTPETPIDVPRGGEGHILFNEYPSDVQVAFLQHYHAPDLMLDIFPENDTIESQGQYEPGHEITIEVYNSSETLKATATVTSAEVPWWGEGGTGFSTDMDGATWDPDKPDIDAGDHIKAWVDAESYAASLHTADARVGAITGAVDVESNSVSGTIGATWLTTDPLEEIGVECYGWGAPEGAPDRFDWIIPNGSDTYTCSWDPDTEWDVDYNQDIAVVYREPEGHRVFGVYNEPSFDLYLNVNYDHDWIEGNYPAGYDVTLWVTESDGLTEKARTTITTSEIPWWGGGTGFSTNYGVVVWDPERPDIQPGDWVYGEVMVDETTTYYAQVQLGTISGTLDHETDSFTGKVYAPWLPQDQKVPVQCHPWGAPEGTPSKDTTVLPDGEDTFTCDWTGEWDVEPGQEIAALYQDPAGHWVYSVHRAYTDELILSVHYDHDWIESYYEAGHEIYLQVLDGALTEKAHITLLTDYLPELGNSSGIHTNTEGANWIPSHPDIQPGDTIHGEVDGALEFTADVKIGTITGDLDIDTEDISGTVDADWLPQTEEIRVICSIWENDNPGDIEDWVLPNGSDPYSCSWSGEYDVMPDTDLMVSYFESVGHQVIGDFSYPAPRLRIEKWLEGGEPGEGGNVTFNIQYRNEGRADAINTIITDTMQGMTYLSDTSGLPRSQNATGDQVWTIGTLSPGEWVGFYVTARVDALEGFDIINTAVISSDTPDAGSEEDRTRTWDGTVIANDTHLNVGKGTWTWNPAPGQDYVYNINVCNNGPTGSTELTLTDTLPTQNTLVGWWGREAGWEGGLGATGDLILTYPSIPGWSCREVYVRVTLDGDAQEGEELVNTAEIFASNDDPDEEDNWTELRHNVGDPYADLSIDMGWHGGSLVPGGQYAFGIYFYNYGNVPAESPIPITLTLPDGTDYIDWTYWDWASYLGEPTVDGNTVTWLVDGLDPGYYGTIEVTLAIDPGVIPGTSLEHSANIAEHAMGETDTDNNAASFSEIVRDHGPNLRIRKWGDWHGDSRNAWYQLQVENIGDETVEGVLVTDNLPTDMELDGGIGNNFWEESTTLTYGTYFTVQFDRLEPSWSVSIYFNTRVPDEVPINYGDLFVNEASVGPTLGDTNEDDNSTSFELTARSGSAAHLKIQKSLIGDGVTTGGNAAFYVEYVNEGDLPAENVTITDTLAGMTFIRDSANLPFTVNTEGTEVTWTVGTLDPGGWIGFFVFAEVTALEEADISNTVVIRSDTPDSGSEEERISTWSDFVAANGTHLNVGKDTWTWEPAAGQEFIYNVNVCNYGSTSSSAVTLTDTLPAWVEYNGFFGNDPDPGWQEISYSPATKTLVLEHTCISANTCSEVHIIAQVSAIAEVGTELVNTAVISGGNEVEGEGGDNTASITHYVGSPNPDLSIWQNWHWGSLTPGGHYRYAIVFRNEGNMALPAGEDIYITASIPEGTSFTGWDHWDWVDVEGPFEDVPGQVSWKLNSLNPGFWGTIEMALDIDGDTAPGTPLINTASVTVQAGETNTENNTSVLEEMVYANGPNLRIRKFGGWAGSDENDQYAWYRLEVENIGDETVEGVDVRDDFPVEMTFTDAVRINDGNWTWDDTHLAEHYFTVNLDRLEPGWRVDINFETKIAWSNIQSGHLYTNTASVNPTDGDINPDDNEDSLDLTAGPDYLIDKYWHNGEFVPGGEVAYVLNISNHRGEHLLGIDMSGNAVITDTLPEGMSYVPESAHLYWCGEQDPWCEFEPTIDATGKILTWEHAPINVDQWNQVVFSVKLDDELSPTNTLINTAVITSTSASDVDPNLDNNTSSYTPELDLQAPEITSGGSTTFRVGSAGSFLVKASGKPTPTIITTTTLPSWLSLVDNGDGTATLSGTPTAGSGGVYELSFTASNGVMPDDTESFTLTVQEAPYFTSADNTIFKVGESKTFTISAFGYPAVYDITYTGSLPDGVSLVDNNDGTATLSGTPAALEGGIYTLNLTATNGVTPNASQTFTLTVNEAPKITSANNTTFTVDTSSGFIVTTTGYPTPTLSKTGTLPNGLTFTPNPDGTATISGTPTETGTFPITIYAVNTILPDAQQSFTLTVVLGDFAPTITSLPYTTFTVGTLGNFDITTIGNPTPSISIVSGVLPTGVSLTDDNDGTATLAGTPAAATGGQYVIQIGADNGIPDPAMQEFTLTINQAPAITSEDNTTFVVGKFSTGFYVTTTGYPTPSITGVGDLPDGIVFEDNHDGTARFWGTPQTGSEGVYTIDITASNGVGTDATQEFTLTVVPTPVAPTITSDPATSFTVGSADSFDITTTGYPLPSIAVTSGTLPTGLSFTDDGDGTARIWGTPATGMGGVYTLTITASNSAGTVNQTFTLTVNEAPKITSTNSTTFTVGTEGNFSVTTTGYPAVSSITYTGSLPSGVTLSTAGLLSGIPADGSDGDWIITITASNGITPDATQLFTLTVAESSGFTIFLPLILK